MSRGRSPPRTTQAPQFAPANREVFSEPTVAPASLPRPETQNPVSEGPGYVPNRAAFIEAKEAPPQGPTGPKTSPKAAPPIPAPSPGPGGQRQPTRTDGIVVSGRMTHQQWETGQTPQSPLAQEQAMKPFWKEETQGHGNAGTSSPYQVDASTNLARHAGRKQTQQ